jgi:hypothetical protein
LQDVRLAHLPAHAGRHTQAHPPRETGLETPEQVRQRPFRAILAKSLDELVLVDFLWIQGSVTLPEGGRV